MTGQRVVPMIDYEDAARAIEFLSTAFGFMENRDLRYTNADGRIAHAQLTLEGGVVTIGETIAYYQGPDRHAAECASARRWLDTPYIVDGVLVYVDDVHAHFEHAEKSGARILSPVEENGPGICYRVADSEGHRWMFMQSP